MQTELFVGEKNLSNSIKLIKNTGKQFRIMLLTNEQVNPLIPKSKLKHANGLLTVSKMK